MCRFSPSRALACALVLSATAAAEEAPLEDNSFLIEEAYNQEDGVAQHVLVMGWSPAAGDFELSFTEEWPLGGQAHQLSATVGLGASAVTPAALGELGVSYRYQLVSNERLAVAPSASMTWSPAGSAAFGLEVGLPVSVSLAPWLVGHWNIAVGAPSLAEPWAPPTLALGQSVIWLTTHSLNLMLESRLESRWDAVLGSRTESFLVGPGARYALDFPVLQLVLGAAAFADVLAPRPALFAVLYLSVEHSFTGGGPIR